MLAGSYVLRGSSFAQQVVPVDSLTSPDPPRHSLAENNSKEIPAKSRPRAVETVWNFWFVLDFVFEFCDRCLCVLSSRRQFSLDRTYWNICCLISLFGKDPTVTRRGMAS